MRRNSLLQSSRLGPTLFVLLGFIATCLGYWTPLWLDRFNPPQTGTRIAAILTNISPLTAGCAALAVYGYVQLWLLQRRAPTSDGRLLLITFAIPVLMSAFAGILLAPIAVLKLPDFLLSLLGKNLGGVIKAFILDRPLLAMSLVILLPLVFLIAWSLRKARR